MAGRSISSLQDVRSEKRENDFRSEDKRTDAISDCTHFVSVLIRVI